MTVFCWILNEYENAAGLITDFEKQTSFGKVLGPGESCSLSDGTVFEVRTDGFGCLEGSFCAGIGINISTQDFNFNASKIEGTSRWIINGL